jgi:hypothetical protein
MAGVEADTAADQAAVSEPAVPGRGFEPSKSVFERLKNPEFLRAFFSRVRVSSEGVRSWSGGRAGVDERGLNTLRLFLRSRLPMISAMSVLFW